MKSIIQCRAWYTMKLCSFMLRHTVIYDIVDCMLKSSFVICHGFCHDRFGSVDLLIVAESLCLHIFIN